MRLPLYQIDAFAGEVFRGNPAAVCPLEEWLPDATLQAIALENNLSETAFFLPEGEAYRLRWFTPLVEVALCGHATLASAYVVFHYLRPEAASVTFRSRSGDLVVQRDEDLLAMRFPRMQTAPCDPPPGLVEALGVAPVEVREAMDYLVVLESEEQVRGLRPDMGRLTALPHRGTIVSAPGADCDFVSRFFAPAVGIPEDPVTGSAHCALTPYWAERLGKSSLHARQVSARGGELWCDLGEDHVRIAGRAVRYLEGTIYVPA